MAECSDSDRTVCRLFKLDSQAVGSSGVLEALTACRPVPTKRHPGAPFETDATGWGVSSVGEFTIDFVLDEGIEGESTWMAAWGEWRDGLPGAGGSNDLGHD